MLVSCFLMCCFVCVCSSSLGLLLLQSPDTQLHSEDDRVWPGLVAFSLTVGTDGHMDRHLDGVSGCEGTASS